MMLMVLAALPALAGGWESDLKVGSAPSLTLNTVEHEGFAFLEMQQPLPAAIGNAQSTESHRSLDLLNPFSIVRKGIDTAINLPGKAIGTTREVIGVVFGEDKTAPVAETGVVVSENITFSQDWYPEFKLNESQTARFYAPTIFEKAQGERLAVRRDGQDEIEEVKNPLKGLLKVQILLQDIVTPGKN
jgi:hypothetical protein